MLANGTTAAKWWTVPPVEPQLKLYIFNYTNTERWLEGLDEKLTVKELGPYVYSEKFEKVNVTFNANKTITYRVSCLLKNTSLQRLMTNKKKQEHRTYKFMPEVSAGMQHDRVVFPNMVLISAIKQMENANMLTKMTFTVVAQNSKIFKV